MCDFRYLLPFRDSTLASTLPMPSLASSKHRGRVESLRPWLIQPCFSWHLTMEICLLLITDASMKNMGCECNPLPHTCIPTHTHTYRRLGYPTHIHHIPRTSWEETKRSLSLSNCSPLDGTVHHVASYQTQTGKMCFGVKLHQINSWFVTIFWKYNISDSSWWRGLCVHKIVSFVDILSVRVRACLFSTCTFTPLTARGVWVTGEEEGGGVEHLLKEGIKQRMLLQYIPHFSLKPQSGIWELELFQCL